MTLEKLYEVLRNIPKEAIVLIDSTDIAEVNTVLVEYHADGRVHVILSEKE